MLLRARLHLSEMATAADFANDLVKLSCLDEVYSAVSDRHKQKRIV